MTWLKEFGLSRNKVEAIPSAISHLTSLEMLSLSNNKFRQFPLHISNMTSLKVLYLSNNKLESIPSEISHLTSLEKLYLYRNQLQTLPASMCLLTNLERLWLEVNPLDPNRTPMQPEEYRDKARVQAALSLLEPKWLKWQYEGINIHNELRKGYKCCFLLSFIMLLILGIGMARVDRMIHSTHKEVVVILALAWLKGDESSFPFDIMPLEMLFFIFRELI